MFSAFLRRLWEAVRTSPRLLRGVEITIVAIVVPLAVWQLLIRMHYELQGPFNADSPMYFAVGRGILNGLVPYKDLFETKPPGVFLLTALSFKLFGTHFLGSLIEALSMPLYPIFLMWQTWKMAKSRNLSQERSALYLLIAGLSGILLALYTMYRAGEYQVESFGAFFSLLYLFVVANRQVISNARMLFASLFLLLAIGMKEPFLFITAGTALILCADHPKKFVRIFLVPCLIALLSGGFLMILLGYAGPYLSIYLPEIFGKEVLGNGSLWSHMPAWVHLFNDLEDYALGFGLLMSFAVVTLILRPFKREHWFDASVRILFIVMGLYLGTTAVAMKGDFFNHHFAFAVPLYTALILTLLETLVDLRYARKACKTFAVLSATLIVVASVFQPHVRYDDAIWWIKNDERIAKDVAATIDRTLFTCEQKHYVFLATNGPMPYGFTKYSPFGPIFFQLDRFLEPSREHFRQTFRENLRQTQLIVRHGGEFNTMADEVKAYVDANFSTTPWPCADFPHQKYPEYEFLYRKM